MITSSSSSSSLQLIFLVRFLSSQQSVINVTAFPFIIITNHIVSSFQI